MTNYKLLYLDPNKAYVGRVRRHLGSSRADIDFYGETSISRGIQKLLESYFDLVITKPFSSTYLMLFKRVPASQYGQVVVLSSKPYEYKGRKRRDIIFHRSFPFEHNLDIIVNALLSKLT